jgi:hypothetical protein
LANEGVMTEVGRVRSELEAVRKIILAVNSPSDLSAFENIAAKTLLLSAASYFERRVCDVLRDSAVGFGVHNVFVSFIQHAVIDRGFHAMFDWKAANVNKFLGLFGPENKARLVADLTMYVGSGSAVSDFMYIGSQRNQLVHGNFASFSLAASADEVWAKFESGNKVVEWLPIGLEKLALLSVKKEK